MALTTTAGSLGAANAAVSVDVEQNSTFSAVVTGTFVGTVTLQALYDATEGWVSAQTFTRPGVSAAAALTAPGNRIINTGGAIAVRAAMTAYTSGTAVVTLAGTPAASGASSGGGGGGAATIADGADVAQGTTTDAGIITDTNGTVIGFLRGAILRWNTYLARIPAALTGSGNFKVALTESTASQAITGTITQGSPNGGGANAWPVTLASTLNEANDSVTGHIGGYSKLASLTITRPANTTAYAAGDEIADTAGTAAQRTLACARVNNGTGVITGASLIYSNNPAVTPVLELYLFDTDPTSAGDNNAFAPTDAQLATAIGVITFPSPKVGTTGTSGNLLYDSGSVAIEFAATGGTTSIFFLLVTRAGFTPIANSETLTIRARVEQN